MPIYEYRCQDCGHEFERMQKFSDPPLEICPSCEGAVQKLISRSTFHLKGDGWYVTDYANKSKNNGKSDNNNSSETSTTSTSDSSDSSKSDSSTASSSSTSSDKSSTSSSSSSSTSSSTSTAASSSS